MPAPDWTRLDATVRAVLAAHDGIAHVTAFDAAGLTRRQTAAAFRRGVLERPRIGWFVDPALPWQAKRAVRVGGIACCVTAAALWGLPVPPGSHAVLHVQVDEHRGELRHNRDRTWVLANVDDDPEVERHRRTLHGPAAAGMTSLVDTLLALAGCVPAAWWVAALDAALHSPRGGGPLLSATDSLRLVMLLPRRRRRMLRMVDARSESCIETLLRLALTERGLPFALQVVLHPSVRVDFLVGHRVVVEADGAAFHEPERDRLRDELLRSLGYRVLRFPYERIVSDLEAVIAEIEAELASC